MLMVDEGCVLRIVHMRLTLLDKTVLAKDKGEREREREREYLEEDRLGNNKEASFLILP
jgi:hypothetical protein